MYCSSNKAHNGTHITEDYITYAPYSCVTADKTPTPCTYQFSVGLQHVQELLVVLGGCLHSGQGTSVHASSQLPRDLPGALHIPGIFRRRVSRCYLILSLVLPLLCGLFLLLGKNVVHHGVSGSEHTGHAAANQLDNASLRHVPRAGLDAAHDVVLPSGVAAGELGLATGVAFSNPPHSPIIGGLHTGRAGGHDALACAVGGGDKARPRDCGHTLSPRLPGSIHGVLGVADDLHRVERENEVRREKQMSLLQHECTYTCEAWTQAYPLPHGAWQVSMRHLCGVIWERG